VSTKPKGASSNSPSLRAYWAVWSRLTLLQFQQQIANARGAAVLFILGKLIRLGFAFLFLYIIVDRAKALAGYSLGQAVFILALFNLSTTLIQLLFRGVYIFRQKVIDGSFDFYLLNPLSELFYSLLSYTDPLDTLLLVPFGTIVFWGWNLAGYPVTLSAVFLIILALLTMIIFGFAIMTIIISIGIRYLEVDNTIMLYRDLEKMAAFPIEIYGKYLSVFLTYLLPFALMATIPARIIFGLSSFHLLLIFVPLSFFFVFLSLKFWSHSLKFYSSASS